MALITIKRRPIQIDGEELPYIDRFTYLSSIIGRDGGSELEIQSRFKLKKTQKLTQHDE